jgi:hypothetical protein
MRTTPVPVPDHAPPAARRCILLWCRLTCYLFPLAILGAVTLPHLSQGDWRGDTGWYAALGWSAWESGKLWTLHAGDGLYYFNKPPLALWIHGGLLHAVSQIDPSWFRTSQPLVLALARLPTVLAAGIVVLGTVGVARQFLDRSRAMGAGVVLALSLEFFRRCREISLDMWQLAFLVCAVWMVAIGVRTRRGSWVLGAGVPVGLALLCKPLMGLVAIPLLAAWLVWIRRGSLTGWLLGAAALAIAVAAPWHVSMWMLHGKEFTAQYFGAEVARRAVGEAVGGQRGQAWSFYLVQILAGYWPWLVCAVLGVAALRTFRRGTRALVLPSLGLVWFAGWFVLLSIFPDRRDRYAVPLYPGLALVAGPWLFGAIRYEVPGGARRDQAARRADRDRGRRDLCDAPRPCAAASGSTVDRVPSVVCWRESAGSVRRRVRRSARGAGLPLHRRVAHPDRRPVGESTRFAAGRSDDRVSPPGRPGAGPQRIDRLQQRRPHGHAACRSVGSEGRARSGRVIPPV